MDVIFRLRGSVLKQVVPHLLLVGAIATALAIMNDFHASTKAACALTKPNATNATAVTAATAAASAEPCYVVPFIGMDALGHKMFGFFVAFLLVFRNATCVHRYNAGRTHLTKMVVGSVELVRKTSNFYVGADEIPDMAARSHGGKEVMAAEQVNRDLAAVAVSLRREVLCIMAFLMADLRGQALTGEDKDHDWMKAQELVSWG